MKWFDKVNWIFIWLFMVFATLLAFAGKYDQATYMVALAIFLRIP